MTKKFSPLRENARKSEIRTKRAKGLSRDGIRMSATCLATGFAILSGSQYSYAAEIVNTATIAYDVNGDSREGISNTVRQIIERNPTPSKISFYLVSSAPGAISVPVSNTCGNINPTGNVSLAPALGFEAGRRIYIVAEDQNQNKDETLREQVTVTINTGVDEEEVILFETEVNSGIFAGFIDTVARNAPTEKSDCIIGIGANSSLGVQYGDPDYPTDISNDNITGNPSNVVFDAQTGEILNGVEVTIIDVKTGLPAKVFGLDGFSTYPSTVISGTAYRDSDGNLYAVPPGGFRFPMLPPGEYRIDVRFPDGYTTSNELTDEQVASLPGTGSREFRITDASYSDAFGQGRLSSFIGDIPLARAGNITLVTTKTASKQTASAGDFIQYSILVKNNSANGRVLPTLTDTLPIGIRFQKDSFKLNGKKRADPTISANGRVMKTTLPLLSAGEQFNITYVARVTPGTPVGEAVNVAVINTPNGIQSNVARAATTIVGELFSNSATIIGRIVTGSCGISDKAAKPVPNIRVLMEDGTYAVTDKDGQYHIENIRPGVHVVQMDQNSYLGEYTPSECGDDTRRAGSDKSQFVDVRGGAVWRADFFLDEVAGGKKQKVEAPVIDSDEKASGAEITVDDAAEVNTVVFPTKETNPRSPSTRIIISHDPANIVELTVNGEDVDPLSYDGQRTNADGNIAISTWRGVPLKDRNNVIVARVIDSKGNLVTTVNGGVYYSNSAVSAKFIEEKSQLIADGRTSPVIAVQVLDENGKPARAGVSGQLNIKPPYQSMSAVQERRENQIAGAVPSVSNWVVTGDEGIAYITLAPTNQTGKVSIDMGLSERTGRNARTASIVRSENEINAWLKPGDQKWVVVGFAAGSVGHTRLTQQAETLATNPHDEMMVDGQAKVYAKGRIRGKWLLTLAYDTDKKSDRQRRQSLLTTIDPDAFYTLYGDRSAQGYDAQSRETIFIKLESDKFYALFGDYNTDFNETELGRYNRTLTGAKGEYRSEKTSFTAFAAKTSFNFKRDEIQGDGLSGPYRLSRGDILLNSEQVTIETRDRNRPEIILDSKSLTRFIDYDIDYERSAIIFRKPINSRDGDFNPVFIVVDYETKGSAEKRVVAGGRVTQKVGSNVTLGATVLSESDDARSQFAAADATIKIGKQTTVRAEAGVSRDKLGNDGHAYLIEVQHQTAKSDARAYLREQSQAYGVGQQNAVEAGFRKVGIDGKIQVGENLSLTGDAYHLESLTDDASRTAGKVEAQRRFAKTAISAGVSHVREHYVDGKTNATTQIIGNVSQSLFDDKLTISGRTSQSIDNNEIISTPSLYGIQAAYKLNKDVTLIADYELAKAKEITSSNIRFGAEVTPWEGGRVTTGINQQSLSENSERLFAAFGISQKFDITSRLSADISIDSNKTIKGGITEDVISPLNPPAIGGRISQGFVQTDYFSISTSAAYRGDGWLANGRIEKRFGENERFGVSTSFVRDAEKGHIFGGNVSYYTSEQITGGKLKHIDAAASYAWRKPESRLTIFNKLEFLYDKADAFIPGSSDFVTPGIVPGVGNNTPQPLDIESSRLVNNFALNWIARGNKDGERTQISAYYGSKFAIENIDGENYKGYTDMLSVELRHDLSQDIDVGFQVGARHDWTTGNIQYSIGPTLGISPIKNSWISVGYNLAGFYDRDFSGSRTTIKGPWVAFRLKFDEDSFKPLGF